MTSDGHAGRAGNHHSGRRAQPVDQCRRARSSPISQDEPEAELLGQFNMVGFTNPKGLEAIGSNLFTETEASGQPNVVNAGQDGLGTLRQGYLEDSSVDPVREVTELIEAQRGYELNSKVISAADQMLAATTQVR